MVCGACLTPVEVWDGTEAAQKAAKMAVDIHGGYGCMDEYAVSRFWRDAAVLGPSAGTSDIMKVIIGRWVLA